MAVFEAWASCWARGASRKVLGCPVDMSVQKGVGVITIKTVVLVPEKNRMGLGFSRRYDRVFALIWSKYELCADCALEW